MDKERKDIKLNLLNILYLVEDEKSQNEIMKILKKYEQKIPDNKIRDIIENIIRKNKDYYDFCDHIVNDILSKKLDDSSRKVIGDLLNELSPTLEKETKNWLQNVIEWFQNAVGRH